jgi:hypothetical protein
MMNQVSAENVGIRALGWIAAQDEVFAAFLAASGARVADLRQLAGDPVFLTAVLDFLLQSDTWVFDFAAENGLTPETPMQARMALGGAEGTHFA